MHHLSFLQSFPLRKCHTVHNKDNFLYNNLWLRTTWTAVKNCLSTLPVQNAMSTVREDILVLCQTKWICTKVMYIETFYTYLGHVRNLIKEGRERYEYRTHENKTTPLQGKINWIQKISIGLTVPRSLLYLWQTEMVLQMATMKSISQHLHFQIYNNNIFTVYAELCFYCARTFKDFRNTCIYLPVKGSKAMM